MRGRLVSRVLPLGAGVFLAAGLPLTAAAAPAPGSSAVPEPPAPSESAPTEVAPAEKEAPATQPAPAEPVSEASDPAATTPAGESPPEVDPDLLGAEPTSPPVAAPEKAAPTSPTPSSRTIADSSDPDAAAAQMYRERFRPAHNPTRLNIAARAMFANMGGQGSAGGRMGGASVDIGPTWNHFGVAATVTAFGGRYFLPEKTNAEMNGLLGAGPTVALGRLALLGRGFLDLRVGYDFFYGIVNQRRDSTAVRPQSGPNVVLAQTENLSPHGPRVRLDMGLLSQADRRFFHGFGISIGWQALVHSFRGDIPFTNMLTMGITYWLG